MYQNHCSSPVCQPIARTVLELAPVDEYLPLPAPCGPWTDTLDSDIAFDLSNFHDREAHVLDDLKEDMYDQGVMHNDTEQKLRTAKPWHSPNLDVESMLTSITRMLLKQHQSCVATWTGTSA